MSRCQLIELLPQNPNRQRLERIAEVLRQGGVVVYPTDTLYGLGCDMGNAKAVERIIKIKGLKPKEARLSLICQDIAQIAQYAKVSNSTFRLMKRTLPGPFTYILPALHHVPVSMADRRRSVGVRIPNNNIALTLVELLGRPMANSSVKLPDDAGQYIIEPQELYDHYQHLVDIVIDAGPGLDEPSTVVDCTSDAPEIIRQGLGKFD